MVIPTGFAQVNLVFTGDAAPRGAQLAIGVENPTAASATVIATAVGFTFVSDILPLLSQGLTLLESRAQLGPVPGGDQAVVTYGVQGGIASEALPSNVSTLVRKVAAIGGRKHRGRLNIVGSPETYTDGGNILTVAAFNDLQTALDDWLSDLATEDAPMVILHSDATTPDTVTSLVLQSQFATQKRRLRRSSGHRAP